MDAVREALDEEVTAHAIEVALDELRKRMAAAEPTQLEADLVELDPKIARALDLAIDHCDVAAVKDRLRDLKSDRARRGASSRSGARGDPERRGATAASSRAAARDPGDASG
jgi:hypothetical protein